MFERASSCDFSAPIATAFVEDRSFAKQDIGRRFASGHLCEKSPFSCQSNSLLLGRSTCSAALASLLHGNVAKPHLDHRKPLLCQFRFS